MATMKENVTKAGHKVAEKAKEVGNKISEGAEKATDWAKEKMHQAGNRADEAAQKAGHATERAGEKTKDETGGGCCSGHYARQRTMECITTRPGQPGRVFCYRFPSINSSASRRTRPRSTRSVHHGGSLNPGADSRSICSTASWSQSFAFSVSPTCWQAIA